MPDEELNKVIGEIQYIPVELPDWKSVPKDSVPRLLRRLNHLFSPDGFDARWTVGKIRELPFYDDIIVVELTNLAAVPAYNKYTLLGSRSPYVIDWTVEPLYKANQHAPLRLTPGTAVAYVEYFAEYVFTADGQRFPISSFDMIPFRPDVQEAEREHIRQNLLIAGFKPPELTGVYQDGSFRVEVFDLSIYSISRSVIFVTPEGLVDWIVTDTIMQDLPVQRRDLLV